MRYCIATAVLALTAGCANTQPQAFGVVETVRPVRFYENKPIEGILAGAVAGSFLGEIIGNGGVAATVLGTVAGGFAGNEIQRKAGHNDGQEIEIRLDNGSTVTVVQPGMQGLEPGQRVRVISGPNGSRVELSQK
jgi:outer membrane lipoprotein SlyB